MTRKKRQRPALLLEPLEPRRVLDSTVVFSEILYHPADEATSEFVELYNQMGVDMDISQWSLADGVQFTFPEGTIVPTGGYLVVARDPAALQAQRGVDALGPYDGQLSNNGERIELRDRSARLMDAMEYDDAGDWPLEPDGLGASLAKLDHRTTSGPAQHWVSSIVIDGTPGQSNFGSPDDPPAEDIIQTLIPLDGNWRHDDSGRDLGTEWRTLDFNDGDWSPSNAVYFAGSAQLAGVEPSPLADVTANASTELSGHTASQVVDGSGLNQGAHVTQPSVETMWQTNGDFFGLEPDLDPEITFDLGREVAVDSFLVWNFNGVDAGGCCLDRGIALADILIAGDDGNFELLIDNQVFAKAPGTDTDFSQRIDLGGVVAKYVKIDVDTTNGVANHGAPFNFVGLSEVQFLTRPDPGNTRLLVGPTTHYFRTEFDFNLSARRTQLILQTLLDDGAVVYLNGEEVHRQNLLNGPVDNSTLTLFPVVDASLSDQVVIPSDPLVEGRNVLAVEVHQAAINDPDMVFGLELTSITSPPDPFELDVVPLKINEVAAANANSFFIELYNAGTEDVVLSGMHLEATDGSTLTFADGTVLAGESFWLVDQQQFQLDAGQRVALYTADRSKVLDAASVDTSALGRSPDGGNTFLFTAQDTPGQANEFALRDEIVINEIMYNYRATAASSGTPDTLDFTQLIPLNGSWRFNDSGSPLPSDWYQAAHGIGGEWKAGTGLLGFETGNVVSPGIGTELVNNDSITYYFETDFQLTDDDLSRFDEFQLRHVIDDGAVFYVNGVEILRFNMADGVFDSQTRADVSVNNAVLSDATSVSRDLFRAGQNRLSVEVHQRSATSSDMLFGTELRGGNIVEPGTPPIPYSESDEEWIELYNRGQATVDLAGWRLDDAVDFRFPDGTSLAAGEYLVVARDADSLKEKYPDITNRIIGDFDGRLNNRTDRILLVDATGNPADEITYFEGGQWPEAADGRGASLELRDPSSDNSVGSAWESSREVDRSTWQTYTYQGVAQPSAVGPDNQWSEFLLGLLSDGEVLLDDIQVIQDPSGEAVNLIQNSSFDDDSLNAPASHWRIIGNHGRSEVVVDPDDPNNRVLRLIATGATEHMHNHGETTLKDGDQFPRISNGTEYKISYRAKWVSGSNLLNTRLYFNRLARTTAINQPDRHGTPGIVNSTHTPNAGPTYHDLRHSPVVPDPNQTVTVSVHAADPQQIANLKLWYSVDSGAWSQIDMSPAGDQRYVGQIAGTPAASIVQFYVEGTDTAEASTVFPREGRQSRALYQVQDGKADDGGLHNLRMIVTPDDADKLHDRVELMSNGETGATIIYNETEVFYDAGIRLSGSQRARPFQPRLSFRLGFNADQLFRGVHGSVTIDRSESTGFGQREHIYHHGMSHAGGGLPSEYNDLFHIITPRREHTGTAEAQLARYSDVFLDEQYRNGSDGQLYEYELVYYPTSTVDRNRESRKIPQPDSVVGLPIRYISDNKEDYRWTFLNKNNRQQDDYSQLMEFTRVMGLSGTQFNEQIGDVIDVDQWLRTFAFAVITGHGDNYSSDGSGHNLQLYIRPEDNRVLQFPHDLDAFFQVNRPLSTNGDLRKLMRVPEWEHMYYGHVHDMIQTTFNAEYMQRWIDHWGGLLPRQNFDRHLTELVRRSDFLIDQIERQANRVEFSVSTDDLTVDVSEATIAGAGWVDVREIRLAGSDNPLNVTWTDVTQWQAVVPLAQGQNNVVVEAFDFQGQPIGTDSAQITSTVPNSVADSLRISELHFNPADASLEELSANPGLDNDDFEFVEVVNIGADSINLLGVHFTSGIDFTFPTVSLDPGEIAVIAQNNQAFRLRYGDAPRVIGQFTDGRLSNSGERISLADPSGTEIISFGYSDNDPWPERADGTGASLVLIDVANTPIDELSKPYRWRGSTLMGGSPGGESEESLGIVINEVLTNTDAPTTDAIELLNVGSQTVDLSGWWLSDSAADLRKFEIPENTRLQSGGRIVFDESDFNPNPANPADGDFALSAAGDEVWLTVADDDGQIVRFADDLRFVAARAGEAFGRFPDGTGRLAPMTTPTLGQTNSTPRVGPIVISEVQYNAGTPSPQALAIDPTVTSAHLEYVEILNPTDQVINLDNWRIRGGIDFDLADGTNLAAGDSMIVIGFNPTDPDNATRVEAFLTHYGATADVNIVGGFAGQLNNGGEKIQLRRPDGVGVSIEHTLEDEVLYDSLSPWPTLADGGGRSLTRVAVDQHGNSASSWSDLPPSPGGPSIDGDLNQDGVINVADVDLLCSGIQSQDDQFDLNLDGRLDLTDLSLMIEGVLKTSFGDSNLDGVFDSGDLVSIFQQGEYEDDVEDNSSWADGDWNCDGDFTTSDLVAAFQAGKYQR